MTTLTTNLTQAVLDHYSDDLLHNALPTMLWMDFVSIRDELQVAPGDRVRFMKYDDLDGDPELTENVAMIKATISGSFVDITVTEYGKSTQVSEKLRRLDWTGIMDEAALLLGRHYGLFGPNRAIQLAAVTGAASTLFPGTATSRITVAATDFLDIDTIRDAVEELQVQNAPKFLAGNDQFYVCMAHPHQLRRLKDDPLWINANNEHETRAPFTGEVGRFDDVVFISSTAMFNGTAPATGKGSEAFLDVNDNAANDLASGEAGNLTDIYQACVFGDNFLAFASVGDGVELRDDGVEDHGRLHSLAWYEIYGTGTIIPENGVVIETA